MSPNTLIWILTATSIAIYMLIVSLGAGLIGMGYLLITLIGWGIVLLSLFFAVCIASLIREIDEQ